MNALLSVNSWQASKKVYAMLENGIIEYCAPTLAGIKSANLFNHRFASRKTVVAELETVNQKLNERGVYVEALLWKENSVLIYTYRKSHLANDLKKAGVGKLLFEYGYKNTDVGDCIEYLTQRLFQYDCFPHEIGVFLGYPLEDVLGFIYDKGEECKYRGLWKVYCNVGETKKLFEKIQKCTQIYLRVFAEGRSISQMTVVA